MRIVTIFLYTGNGYIPTTCLREILRELDDQLTDEELDIMIEEIDSDGSGTVDFDGKEEIDVFLFINYIFMDKLLTADINYLPFLSCNIMLIVFNYFTRCR